MRSQVVPEYFDKDCLNSNKKKELNKQRFFVIIVPTAPIPPQDDQEKVMLNIAQIQDQILSLSEADYYQLRQWFYDKDWENWDRQIEADSDTGKLDFLVADAIEAKEKGILSKL